MKREVRKTTQKYVTETIFERHMRAIAKSLNDLQDQATTQNQVSQMILKELTALHEDNKKMRDTLSGFVSDVLKHDHKINNLTIRVEKLEVK